MKRKIIKATISILLAISITGCSILLAVFITGHKDNYYAHKEALYKTDIIGEWSCPTEEGNHYLKFDETICTYEQISGDYKYAEYTISELNDDIDFFDKDTEKILFYIVKNGIFSPQYYKVE